MTETRIHGDRARFAIEWQVNEMVVCGYPIEGLACMWVDGIRIGDLAEEIWISELLEALRYPVWDCGKRTHPIFCNMPAAELFETLHFALHESDERWNKVANEETWARFDVSLKVRNMRDWHLYLIDCESHSRLIVGHYSEDELCFIFDFELQLETGEYDSIVRPLQQTLIDEMERLRPSSGSP